MRPVLANGLVLGLIVGFIGVVLLLTPFGRQLEEDIGLGLLFSLRGPREAPRGVMIVGIDRPSVARLGLPENMELWSRGLYARLVDGLAESGASLIVFDIFFKTPRDAEGDRLFASAAKAAGNVVLAAEITKDRVVVSRGGGREALTETIVPPFSPLAESALAFAPFVLPKVPVKVSQVWLFRSESALSPTLPSTVFFARHLDVYDTLILALQESGLPFVGGAPQGRDGLYGGDRIARGLSELRSAIVSDPLFMKAAAARAGETDRGRSEVSSPDGRIRALLALLSSPDSRYLNFYGPPGTVPTLSLAEVLESGAGDVASRRLSSMRGQVVFVGLSDLHTPGQKDGFHTVYSQETGFDLSGVEIAATAYANLLEDSWVSPLSPSQEALLLLLAGVILGTACRFAGPYASMAFCLAAGAAYLFVGVRAFTAASAWFPLVVPLFVQIPCAVAGSLLWRIAETGRERRRLRQSLANYLPAEMVDDLVAGRGGFSSGRQVLYGTCLFTDAGRYTALAESLDPGTLAELMNSYFGAVFEPIHRHGGTVSNVVADSVLALWVSPEPDASMHIRACRAAMEIDAAAARFNAAHRDTPLPTRTAVHAGRIYLGSIGALGHYEYRPFGDIVNTTTRIDAINRVLGVRVSVSEEVRAGLRGVATRNLGMFRVPGKTKSVALHEVVAADGSTGEREEEIRVRFEKGLAAFRERLWTEAEGHFAWVLSLRNNDGPALFYRELSSRFALRPPGRDWDGEVEIAAK